MKVRIALVGGPRLFAASVLSALTAWAAEHDLDWILFKEDEVGQMDLEVVIYVHFGDGVANAITDVARLAPGAGIVWIADEPTGANVSEAVASGCDAIITRASGLDDLVTGIRRAAEHRPWVPPDLMGTVLDGLKHHDEDPFGLTARELEVLGLLRAGRSTVQVSTELFISTHTTKNHVRRILHKLGAHSRLEAVAIAERKGILPPAVA